jgi:DNA-binding NtrC family response regulator
VRQRPVILIAGDDGGNTFCPTLQQAGFVLLRTDCSAHLDRVRESNASACIVYCRPASAAEALAWILRVREQDPLLPIVIVAAQSTEALAIAALKAHVTDYFPEPVDTAGLVAALAGWCRMKAEPTDEGEAFSAIVGISRAICEVKSSLARIAASDTSVLITGETGTGKELVAQLLHRNSRRRHRPFVSINCAAIPDSLLESELFGCERGAFTGADSARPGHLIAAAGGTVLLDEIGDMTPYAQAKILRALDTREVYRLGSTQRTRLDIRVTAATNQDLDRRIEGGGFRRDLYYRLNVSRISLPPIRERREDIPALLDHCIAEMNRVCRRNVQGFTARALQLLFDYEWPGNVREIRNVVEHAFVELPPHPVGFLEAPESIRLRVARARATRTEERDRLISALAATNWNVSRAARELHWSRMTLYRKLARYQLSRES